PGANFSHIRRLGREDGFITPTIRFRERESRALIFLHWEYSSSSRLSAALCSKGMNNHSAVISELLSPGTINLNLRSSDRNGILEELVNQIPELANQAASRATLLRAL